MGSTNHTILKEILTHLSDGERKTIFSLHNKYRLSPSEIYEALEILVSDEAVVVDPPWVQLVENYDDTICEKVKKYFFTKRPDLSFADDRGNLHGKVEINEPYLPDMGLLDDDFFDR